jgi:hypothetical protein
MSTNQAGVSASDVSPQTNVVTMTDNSQMITGITYVPNSLQITPGQPSTPPPTITQMDNSWTITLIAGRKNSNQVAGSFNDVCGAENHEYAASGGGGTPSQLNFYFAVELQWSNSIQTGSELIYLGQGSYGSFIDPTNNWWIGGSPISNNPSNNATIAINGGPFPLSGSQDSFNLG